MNAIEHLAQKVLIPLNFYGVDISITNGVISIWLAVAIILLFFALASRNIKLVPNPIQNIAELLIYFIRGEIAAQIEHDRDKWEPFLLAVFLFVIINNLLGLVPGFSGATANINTTAALALVVFFAAQMTGIVKHGLIGYMKSFIPSGMPIFIAIFMIPIEIASQMAKPFSLAIRLFANMFAGHAVMFFLISLIFIFGSYIIIPFSVAADMVFIAFEIFIAFIQAFIFTYLSAFYIASAQECEG